MVVEKAAVTVYIVAGSVLFAFAVSLSLIVYSVLQAQAIERQHYDSTQEIMDRVLKISKAESELQPLFLGGVAGAIVSGAFVLAMAVAWIEDIRGEELEL